MPITEAQFFELEKRIQSFKGILGISNITSNKPISQERFSKSFNVYSEDILTNIDSIPFTNTNDINDTLPQVIRTWVTGSGSTPEERLARGFFSSSFFSGSGTGTNPYVEKIICPLIKLQGGSDQAYIAFGYENIGSDSSAFGSIKATRSAPENTLLVSAVAS